MLQQFPTVLIVEDSQTQAELIANHLSRFELQVIVANDGAQGLRIVAAQKPDFIVLDVNMPRMNGYRMCQRIRRDPETAHLPVVLLTADNTEEAIQMGIEAGADDYIVKDGHALFNLQAVLRSYHLIPDELAQV